MRLHGLDNGGGGGIRTLEAGFGPPTRFPGVRLKPLGHPSGYINRGGEGGIRTHETGLNRLPDFESGSFDQLRHLSTLCFIQFSSIFIMAPGAKKVAQ